MVRTLFPELERATDQRDLCGLKIIQIKSSLDDTIHKIVAEDENGEMHEISFDRAKAAVLVKLDGEPVGTINTGGMV
ncbi:MAG: hypothetical protein PHC43_00310 [Candidatus Marinimicrobia bacterium]|jgi:hypothetical protein|nr:hypothetical protein [Candidatus Neomarinimicrobiota bacterium]